jgi:hypothetical protein
MNTLESDFVSARDRVDRAVAVPVRFSADRCRHVPPAGLELIRMRERHRRSPAVFSHAQRSTIAEFPR